MTSTCRSCKGWKDCPDAGRDWFSYGEIRWCPYQVFFLLKWAEYLEIGIWPTPESTCESPKKTISKDAQYVNAAVVMAELRCRLEKTGLKGSLLAEECKNREKMLYLSDSAKDALYYVAGWRRKDTNFTTWLAVKRYKKYNKVVA